MTVKEIDENIESLKKEIYKLKEQKVDLTKEEALSGLKEGHYYKMHINSCDIVWFKFDPHNVWVTYDSDNVIFSHCLKMHLTLAHMEVGYCNQLYIPLESLGGRSLLYYFEPEEITEEEFMEELEDAKKHIDMCLGGEDAKEKENNG